MGVTHLFLYANENGVLRMIMGYKYSSKRGQDSGIRMKGGVFELWFCYGKDSTPIWNMYSTQKSFW